MSETTDEAQRLMACESSCRGAVTRAVAALLPGKRKAFGGRDKGYWLAIALTSGGTYQIEVAAPAMEHHDEDPESMSCACPWHCASHDHRTTSVPTSAEAIDRATAIYTLILSGRLAAAVASVVRS